MRILRLLLTVLASVIVAGAIASAAVKPSHPSHPSKPTPVESESPEPVESESPEPPETESPDAQASGTAPDFSACVGLTGLDNAICRHEALIVVQPNNTGLQNALQHLKDNKAKQEARASGSHGSSGQAHGHGHSGS